jgi:hypothetical protein
MASKHVRQEGVDENGGFQETMLGKLLLQQQEFRHHQKRLH